MAIPTKVLVVDDSLTMRVLLSGALERIPDVVVVGEANGADEARDMIARLNPDVLTLDIEMPGMSGLEFLEELMRTRPIPVIMFSTLTDKGAAASVEALRLGAIDCFPKPKVSVPAEFDKMLGRLGKRIKAAKGMMLSASAGDRPGPAAGKADTSAAPAFLSNGRLLAIGGETASTQTMFDLFATFPVDCPPTIVVQHIGPGLVETLVEKLGQRIAPKVVLARDGLPIEQGTVYLTPPGDAHVVVDGWPNGRMRLLARDPVAGERPSISILFASASKATGGETVGVLLDTDGEDGKAGIEAIRAAGGYGFMPAADRAEGFLLGRKMSSQTVAADQLSSSILRLCHQ